jgi:hypothetical protein
MKKFANAIKVVAVNLIVLFVLLGGIEFYWIHEKPDGVLNGLWQSFQPYVMVTTAPGGLPGNIQYVRERDLLEGGNGLTFFQGAGQNVMRGGIEIEERQ